MTTHFTADPHFGHGLTTRLFATVEEHDQALLDNINTHVAPTDRLFILGDFSLRAADSYANAIRCRDKHLVWGNHDRNSYSKLFKSVQDVCEVKLQGQKIFCSHYPHAYWPASHHGSLHLYGHCHRQREATLDAAFPGRRSLDCGMDNALKLLGEMRPFTEHEIIEILMARPGHDLLEFYRQFQAYEPVPDHE